MVSLFIDTTRNSHHRHHPPSPPPPLPQINFSSVLCVFCKPCFCVLALVVLPYCRDVKQATSTRNNNKHRQSINIFGSRRDLFRFGLLLWRSETTTTTTITTTTTTTTTTTKRKFKLSDFVFCKRHLRGKRSRGRPSRRWQDDITEKEGTTWSRKATDRRQWKTLMEGYIMQWMDKAKTKTKRHLLQNNQ